MTTLWMGWRVALVPHVMKSDHSPDGMGGTSLTTHPMGACVDRGEPWGHVGTVSRGDMKAHAGTAAGLHSLVACCTDSSHADWSRATLSLAMLRTVTMPSLAMLRTVTSARMR